MLDGYGESKRKKLQATSEKSSKNVFFDLPFPKRLLENHFLRKDREMCRNLQKVQLKYKELLIVVQARVPSWWLCGLFHDVGMLLADT